MDATTTQLADRLLASYAAVGGINHVDGRNLPSKSAIAGITADLLRLLFPGFFDDRPLVSSELKIETALLLAAVRERLEDEVFKSIAYAPPEKLSPHQLACAARDLTLGFLGKLPAVRELLQTDAEAAYRGDPAALSKEEIIVAYPFMEAIAVHRAAHELHRARVPLIPRIMSEWAHARSGMDIHPGATIGGHFFVDHCTGTVIGETAVIGSHVKLYQGVGLVARSLAGGQALRGQKRHPTLEDHVTIYAGATIVGGETVIGEGSTVGGNVFLVHGVPPRSLVIYEDGRMVVRPKPELGAGKPVDFQI
ncbi:MAG TPA: serine O-acetyltransferase [Verrucomicrobiota bacterium]|nr:serine O-acetyltransferase [Verrucomicrobiota bacterium]